VQRLATDEDFNNRILRGVLRRNPGLDIVRAQDVGLRGKSDAEVLEWAAKEDRILLSHDKKTMRQHVNERLTAGLPMPGVFIVNKHAPMAQIVENILILAECSLPGEWEYQIIFVPLK
jgi:predicted nuclease of predicted toxin-antitoxin system